MAFLLTIPTIVFFATIKPEKLEEVFSCFVKPEPALAPIEQTNEPKVVNVDGKRLLGSSQAKGETVHIVTLWEPKRKLSLGQLKVDAKSNEIKAIPLLLCKLNLEGSVVTIDAMGAQYALVQQIIEQKGDYVIALKGNQKNTYEQAQMVASTYNPADTDYEKDACKGLVIERTCEVFSVNQTIMPMASKWSKLNTIVKITRKTTKKKTKTVTEDILFYISSMPADATLLLKLTKQHWSIERDLHWQLDITFGEDSSRKAAGYAAENFSRILRLALNLLNSKLPEYKDESKKTLASKAVLNKQTRERVFGPPVYPQSEL